MRGKNQIENRALIGKSPFVILFITALCLFLAWSRMQIVRMSYEMHSLEIKENKLKLENEKLKLKLAKLSGPERLEKIAKDQLGLKAAAPERTWIIKDKDD